MKRLPELAELVGSIYDAATYFDAWPEVLTAIGAFVGSAWTILGLLKLDGTREFTAQDGKTDPARLTLFERKFTSPTTNPSIVPLLKATPGTIILREQVLADAVWHRTELYREIYQPAGLYHGLAALVLRTDRHIAPIGLNRPRSAGRFARKELHRLSQLMPHLKRALRLTSSLANFHGLSQTHEALWDRVNYGVVLLDAEAKMLWANRAAHAVLEAGDGLALRAGRLQASRASDHAALCKLIDASVVRSRAANLAEGALTVSRPSLRRPYALLVTPISIPSLAFGRHPSAAVIMTDPEHEPEAAPARLTRLYGLTRREAEVCMLLMQGLGIDEIVARLALTRNTVRQHLREVFNKTGTHRQAQLVRFLLRSPVGLLQPWSRTP